MKHELLVSFDNDALGGKIDESIKKLKEIKDVWTKAGYIDIHISFDDEWGYYDEHNIVVNITGTKRNEVDPKKIKNGRDLFKK